MDTKTIPKVRDKNMLWAHKADLLQEARCELVPLLYDTDAVCQPLTNKIKWWKTLQMKSTKLKQDIKVITG